MSVDFRDSLKEARRWSDYVSMLIVAAESDEERDSWIVQQGIAEDMVLCLEAIVARAKVSVSRA